MRASPLSLPAWLVVFLILACLPWSHASAQEATIAPQPANPPVIVAEGTASLGSDLLAWQVTRRETHVSQFATPEPAVPVGFVIADSDAVSLSVQGDGSEREPVPSGDAGFNPAGFRQVRSDGPSPAPYYAVVLVPAATAGGSSAPNQLLLSDGFQVPFAESRLQLWAARLSPPASWTLPQSDAPIALLITGGAVEVQAAGAPGPATLTAGEAAAVPAGGTVAVSGSAEAVVYAAVVLDEARVTPTAAPTGGESRRSPTPTLVSDASGGAPTATSTVTPTLEPSPTLVPTSVSLDSDGDGLTDEDEIARETDPFNSDSDGDGVFDGYEVAVGLEPLSPDSDGDGVSDYDELANEFPDPGSGDLDDDGLTDGFEEQVSFTNPNDPDTDDDGVNDGDEWNLGTDPLVPDI